MERYPRSNESRSMVTLSYPKERWSGLKERLSRPNPSLERDGHAAVHALRERPSPIHARGERTSLVHGEGERTPLDTNAESMHMEREFRLAITNESMHALEVRICDIL